MKLACVSTEKVQHKFSSGGGSRRAFPPWIEARRNAAFCLPTISFHGTRLLFDPAGGILLRCINRFRSLKAPFRDAEGPGFCAARVGQSVHLGDQKRRMFREWPTCLVVALEAITLVGASQAASVFAC